MYVVEFCVQLTSDQLLDVYKGFVANYPVVTIEDAFDQDDWAAWSKMNSLMKIQLVGLVFSTSLQPQFWELSFQRVN
jgi:enolase